MFEFERISYHQFGDMKYNNSVFYVCIDVDTGV